MALSLDGSSQFINFGNVLDSVFAGADKKFAISLWFILNSDTAARRTFMAKHGASENKKSWRLSLSTADKLEWGMVFDNAGAAYRVVTGTTAITSTSTIYHLVVNYDGSVDTKDGADRVSFYLNNVLETDSITASGGALGDLPSTTACLGIGALLKTSGIPDTAPEYGPFKIWDVRVYNRVLTANEIAEIYHKRGADKVWQGLVGWWRLDDLPSGQSAPLLLDAMDAKTGWTASHGAVSLNTTTKQEGTGSLSLSKTSTDYDFCYMNKNIDSTNLTGQTLKIWFYVKDSATLAKINSIALWFGQDLSNRYRYVYTDSLSVGWNTISVHVDDFIVYNGSPTKTNVQILYLTIHTVNVTDTLSANDVLFDFYRAGDYSPSSIIDLSGNGNHGTPYNSPVYQDSPHRLRRGVLVS